MTARPERRRRSTIRGAIAVAALFVASGVLVGIGGYTLANSEEGQILETDDRSVIRLPATANAMLAVTDDDGALESLLVATLLPDGRGGSLVTVPVNADASGGFGDERRPLNAIFAAAGVNGSTTTADSGDGDAASIDVAAQADALRLEVEAMLGLTLERALVVDPAGLTELLAGIGSVEVTFQSDVIDADSSEPVVAANIVAEEAPPETEAPADEEAGDESGEASDEASADDDGEAPLNSVPAEAFPVQLDPELVAAVLTANPEVEPAYDTHLIDVDVWSAVASRTPVAGGEIPRNDLGEPEAPGSAVELLDRLLSGPVAVRDLATQASTVGVAGLDAVDTVVIDRRDVNLVFALVSPGLVAGANPGPTFRIEVGYSEAQLADTDVFATNSEAGRLVIGELLFFQANILSVDEREISGGAPQQTRIEIPDESFREGLGAIAQVLFGDVEIVIAETLIEGIEVTITLGTGYIDKTAG